MKWNVWHRPSERWLSFKSWGRKAAAEDYLGLKIELHAQRKGNGYPADEMEVRRVLPLMEQHGTSLMKLKPKMIWQIAMADLGRRSHNAQAHISDMKPYAFCRQHVIKAESANDILRAAIADPERGRQSAKRDTRLLYSDIKLLKAALQ